MGPGCEAGSQVTVLPDGVIQVTFAKLTIVRCRLQVTGKQLLSVSAFVNTTFDDAGDQIGAKLTVGTLKSKQSTFWWSPYSTDLHSVELKAAVPSDVKDAYILIQVMLNHRLDKASQVAAQIEKILIYPLKDPT
ncbi:MAG: hypothetical protein V4534_08740 [Myxococcota bacterium]